jgi:hypothetical protein
MTENTVTETTNDVFYPEAGMLTGTSFGYGKTCDEASLNAFKKNLCYQGSDEWKVLKCEDSMFLGKRSVIKYTCRTGNFIPNPRME